MRRELMPQAVALLLCVLLVPWPAPAQTQTAGKLSALLPATTRNAKLARKLDPVQWNDLLKSDQQGRARLAMNDGSLLSLGASSELRIVRHDATSQQSQLELNYGKLRSRVVKLTAPGARFEVKTPVAVIGVIGTDFYVETTVNKTIVICYTGMVSVAAVGAAAGAAATTIPAGSMVEASSSGVGTVQPTPLNVQQQSMQDTDVSENQNARNQDRPHLMRNILIGVVAAATAGLVAYFANREPDSIRSEEPPPPTDHEGFRR